MIETFKIIRFRQATLAQIDEANEIIGEYRTLGFILTLRQLFYQFVSRARVANTLAEYKRLGRTVTDARRAGRIDWGAIEDRTRNVRAPADMGRPVRDHRAPARRNIAKSYGLGQHLPARGLDREGRADRRDRGRQRRISVRRISPAGATFRERDVQCGQALRGPSERANAGRPASRRPRSERPRHDPRHRDRLALFARGDSRCGASR